MYTYISGPAYTRRAKAKESSCHERVTVPQVLGQHFARGHVTLRAKGRGHPERWRERGGEIPLCLCRAEAF